LYSVLPPAQPIDSLPQHWDAMPANTSCHSCLIQPGSPEHNEVLNLFRATCPNIVLKVPDVPKATSIVVIVMSWDMLGVISMGEG
jgi:hypothetical protein